MNKRFWIIALLTVMMGALIGGVFGRLPARTSAEGEVTMIASVMVSYTTAR